LDSKSVFCTVAKGLREIPHGTIQQTRQACTLHTKAPPSQVGDVITVHTT